MKDGFIQVVYRQVIKVKLIFFLVLAFQLSFINFSSAQKKGYIEEGYVITMNNDTVHGEIKVLPRIYMSLEIQFKATELEKFITIKADSLLEYSFGNNDFFKSIKTEVIRDGKLENKKYFAEVIVAGKIDFMVVDIPNSKSYFFIESPDFGLTELEQIIEEKKGKRYTNKKYILTLGKYMHRYPEMHSEIEKTNFNTWSLAKVVSDYNSHFSVPIYTKQKEKISSEISLISDFDFYLLRGITNGEMETTSNIPFGFSVGTLYSLFNRSKNMKVEFNIGLNYTYYRYSDELPTYDNMGYVFLENVEVSGYLIEMPLYMKYNNKMKFLSPIIELGVNPHYLSSKKELIANTNAISNSKFSYYYILGFGLGLNTERIHIKYMIYMDPILKNTLAIRYSF